MTDLEVLEQRVNDHETLIKENTGLLTEIHIKVEQILVQLGLSHNPDNCKINVILAHVEGRVTKLETKCHEMAIAMSELAAAKNRAEGGWKIIIWIIGILVTVFNGILLMYLNHMWRK